MPLFNGLTLSVAADDGTNDAAKLASKDEKYRYGYLRIYALKTPDTDGIPGRFQGGS